MQRPLWRFDLGGRRGGSSALRPFPEIIDDKTGGWGDRTFERPVRSPVPHAWSEVIFCIRASASMADRTPAASQGSVSVGEQCDGHHEVSILSIGGVAFGRYLGSQPGAKVSMMTMRPPQQGQGRGSAQG